MFRPPIDCNFCRDVNNFDTREKLSPDDFELLYAHTGRPVKVSDGAVNWTAVDVFDYWYFQEIYDEFEATNEEFNCQFFPYKSGFKEIFDAFRMPASRVNQEGQNEAPWYFGWSNCNHEIAREFRKHYSKPYFLPEISENNAIDWIFIGVPGMGAHLHVDNVRLPSWQAQLKGAKKWEIAPPPECYFQCRSFEVVVSPGEISKCERQHGPSNRSFNFPLLSVVLDTNKWYHKTNVLPGEVSVTIGAEYD